MPLFKKKEPERDDTQAERLRKFRNMYAAQYGTKPDMPIKDVGEPIRVQSLCSVCSEPMEGRDPATAVCPAARAEPGLHEQLRVAMQNWRGGQVTGRTVPHYNNTISLMRKALKRAMERDRAEGGGPAPATSTTSP
ncbi:MAG: hypothetical protein KGJ23_10625 [Euryarchaeota archaeon]|nr:hypothetical protein [Euryarchaeota archaeon]MDE1837057.1 hypothetical protein [Euryarchaeota archaeon]MDE1880988.1 hypothetical protein [Euryarchaeota archaeon]MDE2046377.1 hypothetical protein [Thermoplasmata archaeon]